MTDFGGPKLYLSLDVYYLSALLQLHLGKLCNVVEYFTALIGLQCYSTF